MNGRMTDEQRQLFNINVIRVTLAAALRKVTTPQHAQQVVAHGLSLLDRVGENATSETVRAEVEAARTDILARVGEAPERSSQSQ